NKQQRQHLLQGLLVWILRLRQIVLNPILFQSLSKSKITTTTSTRSSGITYYHQNPMDKERLFQLWQQTHSNSKEKTCKEIAFLSLLQTLLANGHKIVVFCEWTSYLDHIETLIKSEHAVGLI